MRVKWFSWFVEGPAKATWQRTLTHEERGSWASIKKIFQGQYGIHMDPRTAYLRCHELQYEELGSVQVLLEAMREYQRLAPDRLSDTNLQSILWNKVPVILQKEVGEMKDWSLQELFQRLLKAEARVQERMRRQQPTSSVQSAGNVTEALRTMSVNSQKKTVSGQTRSTPTELTRRSNRSFNRDRSSVELQAKNIRCFICNEKGHFASSCTKSKAPKSSLRVSIDTQEEAPKEETTPLEEIKLWTRVLTLKQTGQEQASKTHVVGSAYKVDVTVEGVPTRAFIDHGSQITIVRRHLLPLICEKQKWSDEQCIAKTNCKGTGAQPVGAMGKDLGTCGIVVLQLEMDETGQNLEIPCYVLDSNKPLWQGELKNCAVLLGTNALTQFGFGLYHSNGAPIYPVGVRQTKDDGSTLYVTLQKSVHLKPRSTKCVQVTVDTKGTTPQYGLVTPNDEVLAAEKCDFLEELWDGAKELKITLTNWSDFPVLVRKQSTIGKIEPVELVTQGDPHWGIGSHANVRVCKLDSGREESSLLEQLKIGDVVSEVQKKGLVELLLRHSEAFALTDEELGETSIVEHAINTKDAPPVSTSLRRIPYALRNELEKELDNLQKSGCIEESNSPYTSALVLVRKKGGGLRICVDYRALNRDTILDKYPIPRIDELID